MSAADLLAALDALPRLGWVAGPTPVTPLHDLAAGLGLGWLGAKRDDALPGLFGGSKVRKLDFLLAAAPWAAAEAWASAGAIGSGQLVALTAAAERLGRRLEALVFWEPLSAGVEEHLAFIASGPTSLAYRRSRLTLALRDPRVLIGRTHRGRPVVPPGASAPAGLAGMVRAGLELAVQVAAGELPAPDRVVVALGSGGTAAGLALGLGLGGLSSTVVHAVAAVERPLASHGRLRSLVEATRRWLVAAGVYAAGPAAPIRIDRRRVGPGYGAPTPESLAACARVPSLPLEPVYSGKALASVLGGALPRGERVLFWVTPHRAGPLPVDPDWRDRLPPALRRRLTAVDRPRRRFVLLGVAGLTAVALGHRLTGYDALPPGLVLASWEGNVLRAAAEALLPPAPAPYDGVPAAIDRYVAALPRSLRREIHMLLSALEHGTLLDLHVDRLTRLEPAAREHFLSTLAARGGLQRQMYRGVRDLCMLGYYQDPTTWPALGYPGPMVSRERRPDAYDALRAPDGTPPPGWSAA
jgi:D-cysteine desulfhydrase